MLQLKKGQPLGSKSVLGEREDDARLLLVFYIKDRKPQTKVQWLCIWTIETGINLYVNQAYELHVYIQRIFEVHHGLFTGLEKRGSDKTFYRFQHFYYHRYKRL